MKASEMTNESLARWLEMNYDVPLREAMYEAAARLRRPTPVDDDLLKMARDIEKLNAKLKVAEDALVSIANEEIDDDYSTVAEIALAAIRK